MNCTDARRLIHGYVDGELDLVASMEIEAHLADCGSCLRMRDSQRELKESIRDASLRFDAPKGLEKRILRSVVKEHKQAADPTGRSWQNLFNSSRPAIGFAAFALIAFIAWSMTRSNFGSRAEDSLADEVVSNHVRSLMASHLFDVASTDQHTVKPWFAGKIDFSPQVVDLADKGFPLTGGRLDYLAGRPVAALVYRRRQHIINLFIWPSAAGELREKETIETRRGYHVSHWTAGGMTYYAASDVNAGDLKEFSRRVAESGTVSNVPR